MPRSNPGVRGLLLLLLLFHFSGSGAVALDLGKSGIGLNPPAQGWKLEEHDDAALKVWHLRAETWDPAPKESGLIAVTVTFLDGDPWPDIGAMRDRAADIVAGQLMTAVVARTPFELVAGRFEIAGADFEGGLDLVSEGNKPVSARLLLIRTRSGFLMITAFSVLPLSEKPFTALFGETGILTAYGPGAEGLNATPVRAEATEPAPRAADPAAIEDLLRQMQQQFQPPAGTGN
ncbi:MAG: hypothetical protein KUA43_10710 [Hoeflea sp.]|uniref:hypothetical protein n=1 Tax=Hoeflea sp. TaxID=1940281 RepID=UPI001D5270EB|nr:hypothetical protein [Hoeflea sp.]MBU4529573.1 hypothetical protein [Alphaproteobacteria bacterium]MBU4546692.1 hypothetical protein [Alphaproteobacteria bacterium]MBU4550960.1 hypothetical protein [Alphaproteobacteria bacterium]MBV1723902.1 hypothetical protein [Hoeflea sp.]MBV1763179.1 hypothetical protein [Hoeflea sp.]